MGNFVTRNQESVNAEFEMLTQALCTLSNTRNLSKTGWSRQPINPYLDLAVLRIETMTSAMNRLGLLTEYKEMTYRSRRRRLTMHSLHSMRPGPENRSAEEIRSRLRPGSKFVSIFWL